MSAMESFVKLFNEFEIQLLVLLSFTLQLFLFFAGNLRRRSSNRLLRLSLWAAYLGADLAAVYALGYLSRHQQTQQLVFFWAPFLLIHLGGQDTITAFALEDNNLWLRHLLNLVTQVTLALYVFSKSIGRHNTELLISGTFAFVAGMIKYGERTWSLKFGSITSLESSAAHRYRKELPEGTASDVAPFVGAALESMPYVLKVFSNRIVLADRRHKLENTVDDLDQMIRMVMLQLGMMYDDLYTKALVLRTRRGVILRCISEASVIVAFALFHVSEKGRYSKADIAITYSLFVGCFFLDVCSMFIPMMSPRTWAWLKAHKCHALARLSLFVFYSDIGYPKMKLRWPNSIGQYNLYRRWSTDRDLQPRTCTQHIMILLRKLFVDLFRVEQKKLFWLSKILDTEFTDVDIMIVEGVAKELTLLSSERRHNDKEWTHMAALLSWMQGNFLLDFGTGIITMHYVTETYLRKYASHSDMKAHAGLMEVCRKLSGYMMYLLVTHPSILPLNNSAELALDRFKNAHSMDLEIGQSLDPSKETLEELACMWTRLLLYSAGKSHPGMHAAQLSGGGELITFAWLFMAHYGLGDSGIIKIQLTNKDLVQDANLGRLYAFCVPPEQQRLF
ncbi:uncharacterized protein [Setaria viridis]|uniref:DUF4220 domain-containing protein n=1 Tax=Setaria viridis TaxID=4556 RepID=A0A4U6TMF5_SETVI|nr:uncharacterized protein LOC117866851 [Setaria viridis]TKW01729.1 hypothetical protein SEVIR_8G198300v2 [Setaria viridis]